MPPLAVTEPVKINPISSIEKKPAICQETALAKSLIVLSIWVFSDEGLNSYLAIWDIYEWKLGTFAAKRLL
tara:strand:- start:1018 stop:1230 length:213 start_codon:yes stop_codon:yes gene_type:complete